MLDDSTQAAQAEPAAVTNSSSPLPRIVTIGRSGLIVAALLALLAAILDHHDGMTITFLLRLFGAIALIACPIAAMVRPMRALDVASVALAALLAGAASVWAFNPYDTSVISLFAWFALLGFGGAVAAGLAAGAPIVDEPFSGQMAALFSGPSTPSPQPPPPQAGGAPPPAASQQQGSEGKPPGWYAEADGRTARWWDGNAWTEHTRPLPEPGTQQ